MTAILVILMVVILIVVILWKNGDGIKDGGRCQPMK